MISEADVLDCLRLVPDPELGINIVDLGMVESVDLRDGKIRVGLVLTTPGCPMGGSIIEAAESVLAGLPGDQPVQVELVGDVQWHPRRLSEEARLALMGPDAVSRGALGEHGEVV